MMPMMQQVTDMMDRMSGVINPGMSQQNIKDMSRMMLDMSAQMKDMSRLMEKENVSEQETRSMQQRIMEMNK